MVLVILKNYMDLIPRIVQIAKNLWVLFYYLLKLKYNHNTSHFLFLPLTVPMSSLLTLKFMTSFSIIFIICIYM